MMRLRGVVLAALLFCLASCGGQAAHPSGANFLALLPDVASLGTARQVALTGPNDYDFVDTDLVDQVNASMTGTALDMAPAAGNVSFAVLGTNIAARTADKVTITGTCTQLYIMAANFATGRWQLVSGAGGGLDAPGTFNLPAGFERADGSVFLALVTVGTDANVGVSIHLPAAVPDVWNIMVWIAGDNNLAEFGVLNLNQLETVGSNANVRIFAGFDIDSAQPGFPPTANVDKVRFIKVVQDADDASINVTGDPANLSFPRAGYNSSDPAHVREFVDWVNTNFPAQHTVLDLWSHGAGWVVGNKTPSGAALPARHASCVLQDATDGTPPDFDLTNNVVLADAFAGLHFDVLAFDACNMAQVEALYDFRALADVIVASQVTTPGPGFPYDTALTDFKDSATLTAGGLGTSLVSKFNARYLDITDPWDATLASFDTSKIGPLAQALQDLATEVTAKAGVEGPFVQQAITQAWEGYTPDTQTPPGEYDGDGARDLSGFLTAYRALTADASIQAKIDAALAARTLAVLDFGQSNLPDTTGMAVWLPYEDEANAGGGEIDYATTQFAIDTGWLTMLQAVGYPTGSPPNPPT